MQLLEIAASIVRLPHDALPGLSDVMFNPDVFFQPQFLAYFGRQFQGLTVNRIAQVEADEGVEPSLLERAGLPSRSRERNKDCHFP